MFCEFFSLSLKASNAVKLSLLAGLCGIIHAMNTIYIRHNLQEGGKPKVKHYLFITNILVFEDYYYPYL